MESRHRCEKCGMRILPRDEQIKDNKYYHKSCLNSITKDLINRYPRGLKENFMTDVVQPYDQFKCEIKKSNYLELIPKIALYFHDLEENKAKTFTKNDGLGKLKSELKELFGEDATIIFEDITYGSLLANINIFYKRIKSSGQKALKKLGELFTYKKEETKKIKEVVELIESHSFKCLENLKPNSVKFLNQKKLEDKEYFENEIKKFLQEQIAKNFEPKSTDNKVTEKNLEGLEFKEEEFDALFDNMKLLAENRETELNEEIKNIKSTENFNKALNIQLENAFKESIFEFRITGLVLINKEEQKKKYEEGKKNCPNLKTKILFHATKIPFSSKILTTNFLLSRDNYFGLGVYFTDQLDYAKYYYNFNETYTYTSKFKESFSIVVSEVYYDQTKFKHIKDYSKSVFLNSSPNENENVFEQYKSKTIEKNGVHYAEVDSLSCSVINKNNKILHIDGTVQDLPKNRLIAREYCITDRDQILPLYGINLQRVDYCIIWRDSNFKNSEWKEPLEKNKEIIKNMTGYNLYTETNTKDALKLVYRKRFNKMILITNAGPNLEGQKYINKVRKILGFNVAVLFFINKIEYVKEWIKDYPNALFCEDDFTFKNFIFNYSENVYNEIRKNIKELYGVELQQPKNAFDYPLFENHKDKCEQLGKLELGEYDDFKDI